MADESFWFDDALLRSGGFIDRTVDDDPTDCGFVVVLLSSIDSPILDWIEDARVLTTLDQVLALDSTTRATFTNYADTIYDTGDIDPITVDHGDHEAFWAPPTTDPAIAGAGNGTNNPLAAAILGWVPDTTSYADSDVRCIHGMVWDPTRGPTDGTDIRFTFPPAITSAEVIDPEV